MDQTLCFVFRQIIQRSVFLGPKSDCSSFYLELHSLYRLGLPPPPPPAHTRLAGLSMPLSAYFGYAARPHLPLKWLLLARAQLLLHFRWWTGTRRRYHWQYSPCNITYTQWGLFVWLWLLLTTIYTTHISITLTSIRDTFRISSWLVFKLSLLRSWRSNKCYMAGYE